MEDGDIECPTCGTIHENSIAHRTSILIDMELAKPTRILRVRSQRNNKFASYKR